MRTSRIGIATAATAIAALAAAQTIQNPSFETPNVGANQWVADPQGAVWQFNSQAGIANGNSSWGYSAHSGSQYAFFRAGGVGGHYCIGSQAVSGFQVGGTYQITFWMQRRGANVGATPPLPLEVDVNSTQVFPPTAPPQDYNWYFYKTSTFLASSTTLTIAFVGNSGDTDEGAIVDDVSLLGGGSAFPSFRVTDVGPGGSVGGTAYAVNNQNQATGQTATANGSQAFVWSLGAFKGIGTLGGLTGVGSAINASGQVVGSSNPVSGSNLHAFLWNSGAMMDLGTLGGANSVGCGINDSGQIVGFSNPIGSSLQHAFAWNSGTMTDLGTNGAAQSAATAINAGGQVAFNTFGTDGSQGQAFLLSGGVFTNLGSLGGGVSVAAGLNSAGQIVGASLFSDGVTTHAFEWTQGFMFDIGSLGGSSYATGINFSRQIVGNCDNSAPFLWNGSQMANLNSLVDTSPAWTILTATGINDRGYITGQASLNGVNRAVLLSPYSVAFPTAYTMTAGMYVSGNLGSLFSVDQDYLVVQSVPSFHYGMPLAVVITGTSPTSTPDDLRLRFVGHVDSFDIGQTIEFYDYQAGTWVLIASKGASESDTAETAVATNPGRFVKPGSLQMKARLSWVPVGPLTKSPWSLYIDQAIWNVSP